MQKLLSRFQSALKSYGPSSIKRLLWDREYSGTKWNFAENSSDDCVYPVLAKYATNGSILDLGCGSGNTANELPATAYRDYVGVDISETCLEKARRRSMENGRAEKNTFASGDFLTYVPNRDFDVILFRESMYHVPIAKIPATIVHYSKYLSPRGVFIVRIATSEGGKAKARPTQMISVLRKQFDVVEDLFFEESGATVIVFRLRLTHLGEGKRN